MIQNELKKLLLLLQEEIESNKIETIDEIVKLATEQMLTRSILLEKA